MQNSRRKVQSKGVLLMTLSNEEIIDALLSNPTNAGAAEALHISESYLYQRMRTQDFKEALSEAKKTVFQTCLENAERCVTAAVTTMTDIMCDTDNAPQVRLNAARSVVETVARLQSSAAKERKENNPFMW